MQKGEDKVVAQRVFELLAMKRSPKPNQMAARAADLSGRWEVNMEFSSSNSLQKLIIEQEGNWIQGIHQGDYSTQDIVGTIEGKEIKLRSVNRVPGDSILYLFSGTVAGDSIKGSLFMGEYQMAEFSAKRAVYQPVREKIFI